jgi:predicted outer membrane protein
MLWRIRALAVGLVALAGAALAQPAVAAASVQATSTQVTSTQAASAQDAQFLQIAHQVNLAEIAAGNLARAKGNSQMVKDIGATMVADHTTLDTAVRSAAAQQGVTLPSAPDPAQQAVAKQLQQSSGATFDQLYIATQIEGHKAALAASQAEVAHGTDPNTVAVAHLAIPVIQKHLTMLQAAAASIHESTSPSPTGPTMTGPTTTGPTTTGPTSTTKSTTSPSPNAPTGNAPPATHY